MFQVDVGPLVVHCVACCDVYAENVLLRDLNATEGYTNFVRQHLGKEKRA